MHGRGRAEYLRGERDGPRRPVRRDRDGVLVMRTRYSLKAKQTPYAYVLQR